MAKDLVDSTYYTAQLKGGRIPVKWTAPEVRWIMLLTVSKLMRIMQDPNRIINNRCLVSQCIMFRMDGQPLPGCITGCPVA